MLKVKIKYVTQAKLANATVGKKYATVTATTLVDVNHWLKAVGAVTMGYSVGEDKFLASTAFLTAAKLSSDVSIRFYNAGGKCVAKWVV